MMTVLQLKSAIQTGIAVTIGIIGDSTTCGYGANPGPNLWTNGLAYGALNQPDFGPNWAPAGNPFFITTVGGGLTAAATQANTGIPSAARLLETWLKTQNPSSVFYNYGGSGWTAADHVTNNTVAALAAKTPKPDAVIIAMGINSAKGGAMQGTDVRTLVNQLLAAGILPILCKEHNVAVDSRTGLWAGPGGVPGTPDNWIPMPLWPSLRAELDTISTEYTPALSVIDLGTPDNALDITKLYDPFHPSATGYQAIFNIYRDWLMAAGTLSHSSNQPICIQHARHSIQPGGAVRIKTSAGVQHLGIDYGGASRIKTTAGVKPL